MVYPKTLWEAQNLVKKEPKPITNAFAYNPARVVKESNYQTGQSKNVLRDERKKALPAGKRISKSGKVYWEYRISHSDLSGSKI